ncbi:MAG: hypothetical protein AMXMBFR84_41400 [Candidatus Hydrogenedentota bacterium]
MSRKSGWLQTLAARIAMAYVGLCGRLPLAVARKVGVATGLLIFLVSSRARKTALSNLDLAFKNTLSPAEKRRIARESTVNMGLVAAEFGHIPRLSSDILSRLVRVEGLEHLQTGQGTLLIGAHLGNWEWMAPVLSMLGLRVAEVVRPLDHAGLNQVVDSIRTSQGTATIGKNNAGREIMRLLKEGWIVGVLIDQSPRVSAVPVTFFGERCWATVAPAMIAARTKVPIVVVSMTRNGDGTYLFRVSPPLTLPQEDGFRESLGVLSQACQDVVETRIRQYPGQWLWAHRRWKGRPRLEEEWSAKAHRPDGG